MMFPAHVTTSWSMMVMSCGGSGRLCGSWVLAFRAGVVLLFVRGLWLGIAAARLNFALVYAFYNIEHRFASFSAAV
eukprot:scaffold114849_cov50-Cyclotella_meneghiniana.AAC.2